MRTTVQFNVRLRPGLIAEIEHAAVRCGLTISDFARIALQAAVNGYPDAPAPHAHRWLVRQARQMDVEDSPSWSGSPL